jgi:HprK-related kinase A
MARGSFLYRHGPLLIAITATDDVFTSQFADLYADATLLPPGSAVADVTVQLRPGSGGILRWHVDGTATENASAPGLAHAMLERTLHDAVALALLPVIGLHAAVVARDDGAALAFLGQSGSGKSTLASGFVAAGWRLVADEYLLVNPTGKIIPMPGVLSLKGDSIPLISARGDGIRFGPVVEHPLRGPIAFAAASRVAAPDAEIHMAALVAPTFSAGASLTMRQMPRHEALLLLISQCHNLHMLGSEGFRRLQGVASTPCWQLRHGDLDAAMAAVTPLAGAQ